MFSQITTHRSNPLTQQQDERSEYKFWEKLITEFKNECKLQQFKVKDKTCANCELIGVCGKLKKLHLQFFKKTPGFWDIDLPANHKRFATACWKDFNSGYKADREMNLFQKNKKPSERGANG
jgi:hypothetical protein